jgi:hypothetical protein
MSKQQLGFSPRPRPELHDRTREQHRNAVRLLNLHERS